MKIRTCDKCRKEITSRERYLKVSEQVWDGNKMKQNHAGDLCFDCWERNLNDKD